MLRGDQTAWASDADNSCLIVSSIIDLMAVKVKLSWPALIQAKEVTTAAVQRLSEYNRRTLDTLAARIYFYYSWSYECCNSLSEIRRLAHLQFVV